MTLSKAILLTCAIFKLNNYKSTIAFDTLPWNLTLYTLYIFNTPLGSTVLIFNRCSVDIKKLTSASLHVPSSNAAPLSVVYYALRFLMAFTIGFTSKIHKLGKSLFLRFCGMLKKHYDSICAKKTYNMLRRILNVSLFVTQILKFCLATHKSL